MEGASGGECEAVLVAAEVVALVFLLDVPVPVGVEVAAGVDGAQPQDGLGAAGALPPEASPGPLDVPVGPSDPTPNAP